MKPHFAVSLLLIFLSLSFCQMGMSKKKKPDEDPAMKAFKDGISAFEDGLYAQALDAFQRAYKLKPAYKILYNIGQVQAQMDRPHDAIETFEMYLVDGGEDISLEREQEIKKEIDRLRKLVAGLTVEGPNGSEIWIDGELKGYLPLSGFILLPEGKHRLVIKRDAGEHCEKEIVLTAEKPLNTQCSFDLAQPPSGLKIDQRVKSDSKGKFFVNKVAPWLATGLAATTLTVGIVCARHTVKLNNKLNGACTNGACGPDLRSDVEALPHWAGATDGLFMATSLLTSAAIVLFVAPWKKKVKESK